MMRNFLPLLILAATLSLNTAHAEVDDAHLRAQAKKVADIIEYRGAWSMPKIAKDETAPEALYGTLIDKSYAWIQTRHQITPDLLEVALFTLNADPSQSAGQSLLPLVEANPKTWKHSLEKLPADQREALESNVKDTQREFHEGNG